MTTDLRPIKFAPVAAGEKARWRRPRSFEFANHISQLPLASSELLLTSHHLPVAIDYLDDRPRVVAIVNPRFQRSAAVSADGQWRKGYMPIALRCLPFRLADGPERRLEIAVNIDEADEPEQPVFGPDKSLTLQVRQLEALLHQLEEGKRELQQAAEKLLIADVLRPFQLGSQYLAASAQPRSFTVDRNKFDALSNSRIAYIVRDNFLPIDLAAACIFSQRLMATLVSVIADDERGKNYQGIPPSEIEELLSGVPLEAQVDDGELISFEQFEVMERRYDDKH